MSQYYVTGSVAIFVGVGPGNAPLLLGFCESTPKPSHRRHWKGVRSDDAGQVLDGDTTYQGTDAMITCTVTRMQMSTALLIEARNTTAVVAGPGLGGAPGSDPGGSYGTLAIAEGLAFPLWLPFPYSAKAAFRNPASGIMPAGRRYLACTCENDDWDQMGTNPLMWTFVFHAMRSPSAPGLLGFGMSLFDTNMVGLPPIS